MEAIMEGKFGNANGRKRKVKLREAKPGRSRVWAFRAFISGVHTFAVRQWKKQCFCPCEKRRAHPARREGSSFLFALWCCNGTRPWPLSGNWGILLMLFLDPFLISFKV